MNCMTACRPSGPATGCPPFPPAFSPLPAYAPAPVPAAAAAAAAPAWVPRLPLPGCCWRIRCCWARSSSSRCRSAPAVSPSSSSHMARDRAASGSSPPCYRDKRGLSSDVWCPIGVRAVQQRGSRAAVTAGGCSSVAPSALSQPPAYLPTRPPTLDGSEQLESKISLALHISPAYTPIHSSHPTRMHTPSGWYRTACGQCGPAAAAAPQNQPPNVPAQHAVQGGSGQGRHSGHASLGRSAGRWGGPTPCAPRLLRHRGLLCLTRRTPPAPAASSQHACETTVGRTHPLTNAPLPTPRALRHAPHLEKAAREVSGAAVGVQLPASSHVKQPAQASPPTQPPTFSRPGKYHGQRLGPPAARLAQSYSPHSSPLVSLHRRRSKGGQAGQMRGIQR